MPAEPEPSHPSQQPDRALPGMAALGSDLYWEQDAQFRFTRIVASDATRPSVSLLTAFIGHCRWELPGAIPLSMSWAEHQAVLAAGLPFRDLQYCIFPPGAAAVYVSVSGEPLHDAAGRLRGYRGTSRDVTQELDTRRKLHEAQAQLQVAAALGRFGAWSADVATGQITWSEQVRAVHELPRGHVSSGEQALAMYAPEFRDRLREAFDRCVRQGEPYDLVLQAFASSGQRVWVRVIGVPERNAAGNVVRVHGAFQDVDRFVKTSEQNRLLAERLTMTLESLTDGFLTVDREGRFTYVNGVAEKLAGRPAGQLLGRHAWQELPELLGTRFQRELTEALQQQRPAEFEAQYGPDGPWLHVRAFPSSQGMAVSFTDVTAARTAQQRVLHLNTELEERVRVRTRELQAANRALESFSYSVSHDLRAPLSAIAGFSQVLLETEGGKLSDKGRHYLERICAAARNMDEMTHAMLDLARLALTEVARRPLDISRECTQILQDLADREPRRQVRWAVAAGLRANADPVLARQVLTNLIGNAWKYTRPRDDACIEVGHADTGGRNGFFVRDNGVGFDPQHASKMFHPFTRLHAGFEGSGIGLATVQKIVALHGGQVRAEAQPDAGATFLFDFG